MTLAFLSTDPPLRQLIAALHPGVQLWEAVPADWKVGMILLQPWYTIHGRTYQALQLWQRLLEVRHSACKLALLTYQHHPHGNSLCISRAVEDWPRLLARAVPIKEKPPYPALPDPDILDPIGKVLLSHGANTLQQHLIGLRPKIKTVQEALRERNQPVARILESEAAREGRLLLDKLDLLWQRALPYFRLMPHHHALLQYEALHTQLSAVLRQGQPTDTALQWEISTYLDEVITDIIERYNIEPM